MINGQCIDIPSVKLTVTEQFKEILGTETYKGDYTVIPKVEEQVMETKNKTMTDNVTVLKIPYSEVDNLSGGQTITIGG